MEEETEIKKESSDTNSKVRIVIDGRVLTLVGPDSQEYIEKVAEFINSKITEIKASKSSRYLGPTLILTLAAINVADSYFKALASGEEIREQCGKYKNDLEAANRRIEADGIVDVKASEDYKELKDKFVHLQADRDRLFQENQRLNEEILDIKESAQKQLEEIKEKVISIKADTEKKAMDKYRELSAMLEKEKKDSIAAVQVEMQQKVNAVKKEADEMLIKEKNRISMAHAESNARQEATIEQWKEKEKLMSEELASLKERVEEAEKKYAEKVKEIEIQQLDLTSLKEQYAEAVARLNKLTSENKRLQEAADISRKTMLSEEAKQKIDREKIEKTLLNIQEENANLKTMVETLQIEAEFREAAMESLKSENQELKEEADLYVEEIKRLEDLQKQ